jgi:hypothetical protein
MNYANSGFSYKSGIVRSGLCRAKVALACGVSCLAFPAFVDASQGDRSGTVPFLFSAQASIGGNMTRGVGTTSQDDQTSQACPVSPRIGAPWPSRFQEGPTDRRVSVAIGTDPLTLQPTRGGHWFFAKALLIVKARAGSRIKVVGKERTFGSKMLFTHLSKPASKFPKKGLVPKRGQGLRGPADLPGYVFVRESGCYRVTVTLGGRVFKVRFPVVVPTSPDSSHG